MLVAAVLAAVLLVCPPWGSATTRYLRAQNALKNRTGTAFVAGGVTVSGLLGKGSRASGIPKYADVSGYVVEVRQEGPESCNCDDPVERDWHISIAEKRGERNKRKWMTVEVTPRNPQSVGPWLKGEHVVVWGWTFYDAGHPDLTNRGTAWEIHPVTRIQAR